jgi:hypothetical protein
MWYSSSVELQAKLLFTTDQAAANQAAAAAKSVAEAAKKASDAAKKVAPKKEAPEEFDRVKMSAERAFSGIDAAARLTEGNIMGAVGGLKSLGMMLPKIESALGPIGLALSVFTVWKGIIQGIREQHEKLEAQMRLTKFGNLEQDILRTAAALDQESKAIDRVSDARRRLANIEQAKDDAKLAQQLAQLDYLAALAKGNTSPDDSIGQRAIDLDFSSRKAALQEAADRAKNERQQTEAAAGLSDLIDKRSLIQKTIDDLEGQFKKATGSRAGLIKKASGESYDNAFWSNDAFPKYQKELEDSSRVLNDLFSKIQSAYVDKSGIDTSISEMRGMRSVYQGERQTIDTKEQTRRVNDYVTDEGIGRDRASQLNDLLDQLEAAAAGDSAVMRNWIRQQIAAKEQENKLNAEFMQQMIALAAKNAQQIADATARARLQQ